MVQILDNVKEVIEFSVVPFNFASPWASLPYFLCLCQQSADCFNSLGFFVIHRLIQYLKALQTLVKKHELGKLRSLPMCQGRGRSGAELWQSLHLTELAFARGTMNEELTIFRTKHKTCIQLGSHARS